MGLIPFGAIIADVSVPAGNGRPIDIALGLPTLDDYVERNKPCFGAVVGRYAGRIGGATFTLDGTTYAAVGQRWGELPPWWLGRLQPAALEVVSAGDGQVGAAAT